MTVGAVLLGMAMLIVAGVVVARPLRERTRRPTAATAGASEGGYEGSLLALRELEQDQQVGAVSDNDYARLREQLMIEAAAALAEEQRSQQQVLAAIETAVQSQRQGNKKLLRCPGCDHALAADDRFCPQCGTSAAVTCASCGHTGASGDKFCARCGELL